MSEFLPDIKWPVASKIKLVLIEGLTYKTYVGRKCIFKFLASEPINDYWVEVLRTRPQDFVTPEPLRSA